ncbi:MAG: M20/M25/M40 family metallo-hydrolase [Planctomycetaceae bacterium]|nr:M20/M25/M40 family metallo-hydrolase [Planctomycetaceae bacterium]
MADRSALDSRAAVDTLMSMMAIPGKSGHERAIARYIIDRLQAAGVPTSAIQVDNAHSKSPYGGEQGNLIVKLPGTIRAPRRLLMGHIDTVPLCVGCEPVRKGGFIVSKNKSTALGGDNRAGAAVVLITALSILEEQRPHPPLTLLWPVQEEVGLVGARYVTVSKLGKPQLCFNWDGGAPNVAVIGATGAEHLDIEITGLASHAGAHPEDGVNAAVVAARAIADLEANGWHGLVEKGRSTGTSNIGSVRGGEATNVVLDRLVLRAECRSHDSKFRAKIVDAFIKAFEKAAHQTRNVAGKSGHTRIDVHHKYESFSLQPDEPVVREALRAIEASGLSPETRIVNGGLDANWLTRHGLPTVTLGCGQAGIHTVEETLHIDSFLAACRIARQLATAAS